MMKKKRIIAAILIFASALLPGMFLIYNILFGPKLNTGKERIVLYIPEGSTYTQALDTIKSHFSIPHMRIFELIAEKKNYPALVKPGRYVIDNNLSYNNLINILRSGRQTPVNVTFNNVRTLNDLAGKVSRQIAADSVSLVNFLSDPDNYSGDGFSKETVIAVFLPNTYQFFWNTDAEGFYSRMLREYNKFWNGERVAKAKAKKLTQVDVSILASIIDDEVAKADEKPKIAGVYLNRLKRGIPLQACPTIKFALNDWTITRVLTAYLEVDSPYNTYKHYGLPPGPIGCASIEGIDAVLNAEQHDYLFFAARADFSGYHNFSRTLTEHNRYAAEYQRELNKRKIYR